MNPPEVKTLTRTYPVRVEDMDGRSIMAGQPVKLPVDSTRRLEARFHLDPVKNPVEKPDSNNTNNNKGASVK